LNISFPFLATLKPLHLVNNFSTPDAFPSQKVLMGSGETFINHHTAAMITLHAKPLK
jgi:hypothetical protein